MKTPLVSIIIPTYNRAHLIGETLDSVLAQTYTNWECIVVDDGSTDGTEKLLAAYCEKDSRFQYHHRPNNRPKGANACRNYGFELSKGEYVNWFDDDDVMENKFIETHLNILIKQIFKVTICRLKVFKNNKYNIIYESKMEMNQTTEYIFKSYISGDLNIGTPSVVWSRDVILDYKFEETLSRAQELKFFFDILSSQKLEVYLIREFLILVRRHEYSITMQYENLKIETLLSELKVRGETVSYAKSNDWEDYYYSKSLKLYLKPFHMLYLNYSVFNTMKEIKLLEHIFNNKSNWRSWKIKFIALLLVYKLTNRDYRLNKHFQLLDKFN